MRSPETVTFLTAVILCPHQVTPMLQHG